MPMPHPKCSPGKSEAKASGVSVVEANTSQAQERLQCLFQDSTYSELNKETSKDMGGAACSTLAIIPEAATAVTQSKPDNSIRINTTSRVLSKISDTELLMGTVLDSLVLTTSESSIVTSESSTVYNEPLPKFVIYEYEHYKQRFKWDCGIACVIMLMHPNKREEFLKNFDAICAEEGFGQSTWTIDLCYLLKRFDIRHVMYSVHLGVNEGHRKFSYYKDILDTDRPRIIKRFEEAAAKGIRVKEGTVCSQTLLRHLAQHGPIIVLVDAGLLVCDLCKHNKLKNEFRRCFGGSFTGHYILIVGFRLVGTNYRIFYRDPWLKSRICATTPARLAAARLASGTDQDLILIYNR